MPLFIKDVPAIHREIVGFECSRCKAKHDETDIVEMQEMMHWTTTGGFGSVWGDGATVEVTLCQKCVKELFGEFATIHDA